MIWQTLTFDLGYFYLVIRSRAVFTYIRFLETTEAIPFLVVQPRINLLS